MVQMDGAVIIDMHQRSGLVEGGHGEGDAEFDRGERNALADDRAGFVEFDERLASSAIVA